MDSLRNKLDSYVHKLVQESNDVHTARNVAVRVQQIAADLDCLRLGEDPKPQLIPEERLKEIEAQDYAYGTSLPEKRELVRGYREFVKQIEFLHGMEPKPDVLYLEQLCSTTIGNRHGLDFRFSDGRGNFKETQSLIPYPGSPEQAAATLEALATTLRMLERGDLER